ncbi:MAG: AmmeMemoRadiSam system radical SAM enzyme [Bacteroidetes bacterium]|nr:AmmeMemoRadiSam system radical SAM enzyme [Bacteroidota bacterium]
MINNAAPELPDELWKWSKEASHYIKNGENAECELCPHYCIVRPGKTGTCRTRINVDGKLYSIAYGNPCSTHVDPIEKKPLYHFYPSSRIFSISTAGCNLRCLNCQNWSLSQVSPKDTSNYDLMPEQVLDYCIESNCKSIAYTYGEPIVYYEYTYDTSKLAREKGIKNVLVSAGYINEKPLRELCKYTDAANIDLKSFDDETYKKLNGGSLKPVLETLKTFHDEGVWLEITNLVVPEWTDNMDKIKEMCDWLYENGLHIYPLHFSRFSPMYKLTQLPPTPVSKLEKAREIALAAGIRYVYIGNVPGSEGEDTICPKCKKKLIERRGYFISDVMIKDGKCSYCGEPIHGVFK